MPGRMLAGVNEKPEARNVSRQGAESRNRAERLYSLEAACWRLRTGPGHLRMGRADSCSEEKGVRNPSPGPLGALGGRCSRGRRASALPFEPGADGLPLDSASNGSCSPYGCQPEGRTMLAPRGSGGNSAARDGQAPSGAAHSRPRHPQQRQGRHHDQQFRAHDVSPSRAACARARAPPGFRRGRGTH